MPLGEQGCGDSYPGTTPSSPLTGTGPIAFVGGGGSEGEEGAHSSPRAPPCRCDTLNGRISGLRFPCSRCRGREYRISASVLVQPFQSHEYPAHLLLSCAVVLYIGTGDLWRIHNYCRIHVLMHSASYPSASSPPRTYRYFDEGTTPAGVVDRGAESPLEGYRGDFGNFACQHTHSTVVGLMKPSCAGRRTGIERIHLEHLRVRKPAEVYRDEGVYRGHYRKVLLLQSSHAGL